MSVQLNGTGICLRPITKADTDDIVRWRNDPEIMSHFVIRTPFTRKGHLQWLKEQVETGRVAQFIVCEQETSRPVGSVYLRDIDRAEMQAEYGILIGEADARGKGYGAEAARLALQYAFDTLRLQKVYLRVYTDNAAAIGSYLRAGFRQTEILKDVVSTDGSMADMYRMEVSRTSWKS